MVTIVVIGLILLACVVIARQYNLRIPEKPTDNLINQTIQEHINSYFGAKVCRTVTVFPLDFMFDTITGDPGEPKTFIVTCLINKNGIDSHVSMLIDDLSEVSIRRGADLLIAKIANDTVKRIGDTC